MQCPQGCAWPVRETGHHTQARKCPRAAGAAGGVAQGGVVSPGNGDYTTNLPQGNQQREVFLLRGVK